MNVNESASQIYSSIFRNDCEAIKQVLSSTFVQDEKIMGSVIHLFIDNKIFDTSRYIYAYKDVLSPYEYLTQALFFKTLRSLSFHSHSLSFYLNVLSCITSCFDVARLVISENDKKEVSQFIHQLIIHDKSMQGHETHQFLEFFMTHLQGVMSINGNRGLGYMFFCAIDMDHKSALEKLLAHPGLDQLKSWGALRSFESIGFFEIIAYIMHSSKLNEEFKAELVRALSQRIHQDIDFEPKNGCTYFILLVTALEHSLEIFQALLDIHQLKTIFVRSWNCLKVQEIGKEISFGFSSNSNDTNSHLMINNLLHDLESYKYDMHQVKALQNRIEDKKIKNLTLSQEIEQEMQDTIEEESILALPDVLDEEIHNFCSEHDIQQLKKRHHKKTHKLEFLNNAFLQKNQALNSQYSIANSSLGKLKAIFSSCQLTTHSADSEIVYRVYDITLKGNSLWARSFPYFVLPHQSEFFSFKL
ncbi:MAG: hypothetical protein QRY72_01175 [Candidatus Rhabdochlamydia sp.]